MARLGEIIDGKYEILREIGKGGMSIVYLAMDKRLNKQWAIKEFRKDKDDASKQVALKALLDEANLMKKLDHPTLPRIVDIIETNQTVYIVMDYIEGESLNKVLDAYGAQPQEAVIEWAKQLSDVLDYLHTQNPPVIYRDMKPANIMLKPDGSVRLIDFGIAREYKEGKEGDTEAIGTRGYAAPEQFGGRGQTDARTDIYSLGVTLYHLVTGKNPAEPPYEIYPIRHWNPSLSSGLEWLIQKCTQLNPNDRYQSCAEVTYVLENLDKFEGTYQKAQRGRVRLFWTSVILTIAFTCLGGIFLLLGKNADTQTYEAFCNEGTVEGYTKAIYYDNERTTAYEDLIWLLKTYYNEIYSSAPKDENGEKIAMAPDQILIEDITHAFSYDNMNALLKESPETYAKVHYELGRLYWNNYKDDKTDGIRFASQEFEKVMWVKKDRNLEYAGLEKSDFDLACVYYLVTYFQLNKDKLDGNDAGDFQISEEAITAGVEEAENGYLKGAYGVFWDTNMHLLEIMVDKKGTEMTDLAKLNTMDKLAYILSANYANFGVSSEEILRFYDLFEQALAGLKEPEKHTNRIQEIKNSLNQTAKSIEGYYDDKGDIEIEVIE